MTRTEESPATADAPPSTGHVGGRFAGNFWTAFSDGWNLRRIGLAGLAATVLIAVGSYGAGALPANDPTRELPVVGLLRHGWLGLHVALGLYYAGLVLLILTWLVLGRLLLTGSPRGESAIGRQVIEPAVLRRTLTRWMLPLLVSMPLASMDMYSYAAQAQLARLGRDPYTFTPADLPGKFLDNVAWKWVDTPSPYGPAWVMVSRWVATLTGNHALITVFALRLIPFAAILVIAYLLPGLAQRFGKRGDLALWIGIANPLVLVHGVGGGHNDAVMVAFIVAGLAVVLRPNADWRHLAAGSALMALAAAVKAPGAVGIAFVVPIYLAGKAAPRSSDDPTWPNRTLRPRDWLRSCAVAAAAALPVFALITWMVGYGNGWLKQLSSTVPVINLMSLPTLVAVAIRAAAGQPQPGNLVEHTVRLARRIGTIISLCVLVGLWLRATRVNPMRLFALAMLTVVLLSPAVQPWYFTWALTLASLFLIAPRQLYWLAAVSVGLTLAITPMGSGIQAVPYVVAVLAAGLGTRALLGPVVHRVRAG